MTYEKAKEVNKKLNELEECDKIIEMISSCKVCLRYKNGGIAHTFDDGIKRGVEDMLMTRKIHLIEELERM